MGLDTSKDYTNTYDGGSRNFQINKFPAYDDVWCVEVFAAPWKSFYSKTVGYWDPTL